MLKNKFLEELKEFDGYGLHLDDNGRYPDYDKTYSIDRASFGDYDNSCQIERSNYQVIEKQFKDCDWIDHVSGGYNYQVTRINITTIEEKDWTEKDQEFATEIIDILSGLNEYPVLNEDNLSKLEFEAEQEYISECHSEIIDAIGKELKIENLSDYDYNSENLEELLHKKMEENNIYASHEAGGLVNIDFEDAFNGLEKREASGIFYLDLNNGL